MTTNLGPLDQALHDFCRSLEAPMRTALFPAAKAKLRFSGSGKEVIGTMKVSIGYHATKLDFGMLRPIDVEGRLDEVTETFETPEWTALVDALRRSLPFTAWPITFDIRFYGEECASECCGLGFAGLHYQRLLGASSADAHPSDLFVAEPSGVHGIYGLDRIAEAMLWLSRLEVLSAHWYFPLCAWSFLGHEGHTNELDWVGVHAKSEAEAALKIAMYRKGFQATKAAYERHDAAALGNAAALGEGDNASLVPVRLTGLHHDPRGRLSTVTDIFAQLWVAEGSNQEGEPT